MEIGFVLIGQERLAFAAEAIAAAGLHHGDRLPSLDKLDELIEAEAALLQARNAIAVAQIAALGGGQ